MNTGSNRFLWAYRWFGSWALPTDSRRSRRAEGCSWMNPLGCLLGRSCSAAVCCIWTELFKDNAIQSGLQNLSHLSGRGRILYKLHWGFSQLLQSFGLYKRRHLEAAVDLCGNTHDDEQKTHPDNWLNLAVSYLKISTLHIDFPYF